MLHIMLTILKIPLILLAILLTLLLVLALLLLFVPVRYRFQADSSGETLVSGRIHWLLHLLSVRFDYRKDGPQLKIKLLGFVLAGKERAPAEKKISGGREAADRPDIPAGKNTAETLPQERPERETEPQAAQPQAEPIIRPKTEPIIKPGKEPAVRPTEQKRKKPGQAIKRIFEKIRNSFYRLLEKIRNIKEAAGRFKARAASCLDLWRDEHTQNSVRHVKKELFYLLKHYLPGKLDGYLRFGLSDPAVTGQLLGIFCIAQVFTGNHVQVEADFEKPVFEGRVFFKGHIRACHLLKAAGSLLLDRHFRISIKRIRTFTQK